MKSQILLLYRYLIHLDAGEGARVSGISNNTCDFSFWTLSHVLYVFPYTVIQTLKPKIMRGKFFLFYLFHTQSNKRLRKMDTKGQ